LLAKQPQTCRKCWNEERAGPHQQTHAHLGQTQAHVPMLMTWTADAKPLMFLDLKLGNICNLKCRICGSGVRVASLPQKKSSCRAEDKKSFHHYQMLKDKVPGPEKMQSFGHEIDQSRSTYATLNSPAANRL
jgi:hypothetical protein